MNIKIFINLMDIPKIKHENLTGYKCNTHYWENNLWYHPIIQIIIIIIISFILSYFSLGFFFFLIIYTLSELFFGFKIGFMYTVDIIIIRFSIFLAAIFGFTLGRIYLSGDNDPFRYSFHEFL